MTQSPSNVQHRPGHCKPDAQAMTAEMTDEGLSYYRWSNGPGDVYAPHHHSYHKVIYVVTGSITFGLPDIGDKVSLRPGDRLDLPAGIVHNAVVGPQGVVCLEGHRS